MKVDPKFAVAHAGLADAQWAMYLQTNDKSWAQRATGSTQRAIELEPNRPSVRYVAALTSFRAGRYAEAEQEVMRALELQPTYEDAIRLHARILTRTWAAHSSRPRVFKRRSMRWRKRRSYRPGLRLI